MEEFYQDLSPFLYLHNDCSLINCDWTRIPVGGYSEICLFEDKLKVLHRQEATWSVRPVAGTGVVRQQEKYGAERNNRKHWGGSQCCSWAQPGNYGLSLSEDIWPLTFDPSCQCCPSCKGEKAFREHLVPQPLPKQVSKFWQGAFRVSYNFQGANL